MSAKANEWLNAVKDGYIDRAKATSWLSLVVDDTKSRAMAMKLLQIAKMKLDS